MTYEILLIEDNLEMAENISSILNLANYQVRHAANGKSGIDLAQQYPPDLILCDIMMPDLDGYGVIHILHNHAATAKTPFIFLTAKSDFRKGMNLGADDYITKPFDGIELLRVIEQRLKKSFLWKSSEAVSKPLINTFQHTINGMQDFQRLHEHRSVRKFKKKDLLFMEGQTPNDLYFIEQGRVKTYKISYSGKELITGMYGKGDFIGFIPLIENTTYNENAEVIEDLQISVIPKFDFLSLVYSSQEVNRKFFRLLSGHLQEMENRLIDIAYHSVRQRVAGVLLKLNEKVTPSSEFISISRRDISNIVGTTIESLNRTLSDFKSEGLLEMSGVGIKILQKNRLERILH